MYNNTADVQKFAISQFDGDNQGFEKSRVRSPLASRTYRPGNTHLQHSKLSPDAVLPSVVFAISDWKLHSKNLPNEEKCKHTHVFLTVFSSLKSYSYFSKEVWWWDTSN